MNETGVMHRRGRWRRYWTYWHYGAAVYPDGIVTCWHRKHETSGYVSIPLVDDHLNTRDEPWDGHTQGHCGEHISIFGRDQKLVAAACSRAIKRALARQNGTCQDKFHKHRGAADGFTVYETGTWGEVRRRGEKQSEKTACMGFWDHDWEEWGAWRQVQGEPFPFYNRRRICRRCICCAIEGSGAINVEVAG